MKRLLMLFVFLALLTGCDSYSAQPENRSTTGVAISATNNYVGTAISGTMNSPSHNTSATLAAIPTTTAMPGGVAMESTSLAVAPVAAAPVAEVKAGEIDDNKLWDKYLDYRQKFDKRFTVHNVDITERYTISVLTSDQKPILGARVRIYGGNTLLSDAYTYSNGQTLFFPKAIPASANQQSFQVMVEKNGTTNEFTLTRKEKENWSVVLKAVDTSQKQVKLDVLFLLDSTGSMGDEIAQLQSNILSISDQLNQLQGSPDIRYGIVTYRDRGDDYISQIYQFTPDIKAFQKNLNDVHAGGGGDQPESLNAGLHDAVAGVEWRGDDTVKLVFLVADAPPHLDYPDDYDYAQEIVQASRHGIKIFSLGASGLDDQGEYIFRQIAQYTMGHFIFITYAKDQTTGKVDESKAGDDTNRNVAKQDYEVELLDKLVLRLIKTELAPLTDAGNQEVGK